MTSAILLASVCGGLSAQTNEWTWVTGSSTAPANGNIQPAVYGTMGVASPGNTPGGRRSAAGWTDLSGNLWLFGGINGSSNFLNDLWKFDTSTNEWTWVSPSNIDGNPVYGTTGVPGPQNTPGARYGAAAWTDDKGNLWLFAGGSPPVYPPLVGYPNELWEFDTHLNQWAFMGGGSDTGGVYGTQGTPAPGNVPPGQYDLATWKDSSGNLWLFGGDANVNNLLDEVWKFDLSVNQWAWMGPADPGQECLVASDSYGYECVVSGEPAVYGTLGVPSSTNTPGGRESPTSWADSSGNLWIFGGWTGDFGSDSNDLWEFNVSSGEWTWVGGNINVADSYLFVAPSTFGTLGVPAASNLPPGRDGGAGWVDSAGNMWMFGGESLWPENSSATDTWFNDLWMFDPSNGEWAWMGGDTAFPTSYCFAPSQGGDPELLCGRAGIYGTQGTPGVGQPGSRENAVSWVDGSGNFWLFGGSGIMNGGEYYLNDLWKYQPQANSLPPAVMPIFSQVSGTYNAAQPVTISNGMANATFYYTTDGTTPTTSSTIYTGPVLVSSNETLQAIATATGYPTSGVASATYTILLPTAATPDFSVPSGTYRSAQTVEIYDGTGNTTIYYTTDSTTPTASSTLYSGPINVSASETIEAIAVGNGYAINSAVASATYTLPITFQLTTTPSSLTLRSGAQGTLSLSVTPQNGFNSTVSFACAGLPSGASCAFSPATVMPQETNVVVLTVTAPSQSAALRRDVSPFIPGGVLAAALCVFGRKKKHWARQLLLLISFAASLGLVSACGSSSSKPVPSTVTVTGSSGSIVQSTTFSLTVN